MNYIEQIFNFVQRIIIWWVTIMPWERAVHVRAGRRIRILEAGMHIRIPFIDRVYVQETRLRVLEGKPQTVTTQDGKVITVVMAIGYSITDILQLYNTLYQAEQTLANIVQSSVAEVVATHDLVFCNPRLIEENVVDGLAMQDYGLEFKYVKVTNYAIVKTFRLIQDGHYLPDGLNTARQKD